MRILRALIILQKATNKMFLLKKQVFLWLFQVNSLNDVKWFHRSCAYLLALWLMDYCTFQAHNYFTNTPVRRQNAITNTPVLFSSHFMTIYLLLLN